MALPHTSHGDAHVAHEAADPAEAIRRARAGERVVVTGVEGVPVAAVVPLADLRRLEADDRRRAEAAAALTLMAQRFQEQDPDEADREAQAAVDAMRARRRMLGSAGRL